MSPGRRKREGVADWRELIVPVVVIGGGQAGLSASWYLGQAGVEHLVLERRVAAWEWRERRWDSFCLVTPNWQCHLPGFDYPGPDPDGFMVRDDVVAYLDAYVSTTDPPLLEGVEVTSLRPSSSAGFDLESSAGRLSAEQVVIATGPYHLPSFPRIASQVPQELHQIHSSEYRNPQSLAPGAVLVVGTGQSGCQIAEDLHLAGRQVHLATGSAPRAPRRYRGSDVVRWLDEMGYYRTTLAEHPLGALKRDSVNHYVTGRDGGHDIDLRQWAAEGMELYGRLSSIQGAGATFADDLAVNLNHADAVAEGIKDRIDAWIETTGVDVPTEDRYVPVWEPKPGPRCLDLAAAGVSSIVWATGFVAEHGWIQLPVFDTMGQPHHQRGVTDVPGIYFLGLPWLHTWGSARFAGIAADAAHVVSTAVTRLGSSKRISA